MPSRSLRFMFLLAALVLWYPHPVLAQEAALVVSVDSSSHDVVLTVGPFRLKATRGAHLGDAMHDESMMPTVNYLFTWPVDGTGRGGRLELRDAAGNRISQRVLHHLNIINTSRRQLLLPIKERILAMGRETPNLMLPKTIGLPLSAGTRMRISIMWENETATDLDAVYLTLRIRYSPANLNPPPVPVLPISMDVADMPGQPNTFTVPSGSDDYVVSREFVMPVDARLLGVSGHLHDWGKAIRLEDATNGKVLTSITTRLDSVGKIHRMPTKLFGIAGDGIRLRAQRRYRVVVVYTNPTGKALASVMGHLDGIISLDDLRQWPAKSDTAMAYLDAGVGRRDDAMDMESRAMTMPMVHDSGAHEHQH